MSEKKYINITLLVLGVISGVHFALTLIFMNFKNKVINTLMIINLSIWALEGVFIIIFLIINRKVIIDFFKHSSWYC